MESREVRSGKLLQAVGLQKEENRTFYFGPDMVEIPEKDLRLLIEFGKIELEWEDDRIVGISIRYE